MPLLQITYFTVQGSGEFPWDMLRFDMAFPASSDDFALMYPRFHVDDPDKLLRRRIRLGCVQHGGPTVKRWESFTWKVVSIAES